MTAPDSDYFRRRAAEEREAADHAQNEQARRSHDELAERYDDAADGNPDIEQAPDELPAGVLTPEFRVIGSIGK